MPVLDDAGVHDLIERALVRRACVACGAVAALDYCRTCDEFYWLHGGAGCELEDQHHYGHRLTIVPFVEER